MIGGLSAYHCIGGGGGVKSWGCESANERLTQRREGAKAQWGCGWFSLSVETKRESQSKSFPLCAIAPLR